MQSIGREDPQVLLALAQRQDAADAEERKRRRITMKTHVLQEKADSTQKK